MPQPFLTLLTRVRIGPRLVAGFLLIASGCAYLGYVSLSALGEIRGFQVNAATNIVPSAIALDKIRAGALQSQRAERGLVIFDPKRDESTYRSVRGNLDAGLKSIEEGAKSYSTLPLDEKEAAMWKDIQSALADWKRDQEDIVTHADKGETDKARAAISRELKTAARLNQQLQELMAHQERTAKHEEAEANSTYGAVRSTLRTTIAGAVIVAVGLGMALSASVTRPLGQTVDVLEGVARGDLSRRADVDTQDEVGRMATALNAAIDALVAAKEAERVRTEQDRRRAEQEAAAERERIAREAEVARAQAQRDAAAAAELREKVASVMTGVDALAAGDFTVAIPDLGTDDVGRVAAALNKAVVSVREALDGVREVSEQLADASAQLSRASEEISAGAQEQAGSLEETAGSLEEITATVRQNADNAQQARQLVDGSKEVAEKGGQVVGSAVGAMAEINESSKKIADIITTIDEIAFQTNLLALNAAVEAARAGEQGRGFAVVATEVRNLAQRSATAAKEIKGLIQDSVKKVDAGTELVNKSGTTLGEIVTSVKRVADIITEIASASREQSTGIEQVNRAVSQMDTVTQRNASQTEEMSATSQALTDQADQLRNLIARFKLSGDGRGTPRSAAGSAKKAAYKSRPAVTSRVHSHEGGNGFAEF
ncbi:methyl-accepting chemotaxis protein [Gemmata sp. JC717]|uniref:methyl-accepting chemotaxis protein n=1 Tax=Gemmata algarum TaxID=2975278 RepID=UPI0021BB8318|nr:methyl-accepting chemotaxis protein [Gemmata algarum]MDY3552257.1 methyl-accepting chemotaxis protein [Gemmata algarum]